MAEKMKLSIKDLIDELQREEKCIKDYQTELELLIQEKMAHVEELRLIHTDINTVGYVNYTGRHVQMDIQHENHNRTMHEF